MSIFGESLGGLSGSEVPQSHGLVPRGRQKIVVVVGQSEIADEVVVSGEGLDGDSEVRDDFGFVVELPDEDGSISGGGDEDLGVFILFLGVSGFDSGDPVGVTLEVSDFVGSDDAFFGHGNKLIN